MPGESSFPHLHIDGVTSHVAPVHSRGGTSNIFFFPFVIFLSRFSAIVSPLRRSKKKSTRATLHGLSRHFESYLQWEDAFLLSLLFVRSVLHNRLCIPIVSCVRCPNILTSTVVLITLVNVPADNRHDSDNEYPRTQNEIEDLNKGIAKKFLEIFTPDKDDPFQQRIPIVPSIGNNDVYPHNIMQAGPNRILQHFSDIWSEFIPESQYHTFQHGGYYISEVVPGKIAVVALNTLYFFNQNAAVDGCKKEDEPGTDQMDWLEVELDSLRKRQMTAYLTGHVPPARKSYSITCFARYTDIALRFQDVIVGHLYGHANIDHFFLLSQASLTPEIMEEEEEEAGVAKKESQVSLRTQRRYEQDDDDEYDPFHAMGLNSYLVELWDQYGDIPSHAKLSDYAIVLVGPSVVPTYNPTLRVFSYQLAIEKGTPPTIPRIAPMDEEKLDEDDEEVEDTTGKKKKKKKKKPKKPKKPSNPPAALPITFGFPLNYTQYWMNLTEANIEQKRPEYKIEYTSNEAYGLKDLSVTHFLNLARQITKDTQLKEIYLARMVVQTGTENDH